jgi:MacB-like periplasmic core domain
MFADLLHACRVLFRAKAFSLIAIFTLALGIGSVTAVFSIINGALLRPLPYRNPDRLVEILDQSLKERGENKLFATYADYREYARHAKTLDGVAGSYVGRKESASDQAWGHADRSGNSGKREFF